MASLSAAKRSNKKSKRSLIKKLNRDVSELSFTELAKTTNSKRANKQQRNAQRERQTNYNGGRIDRFPRGNKQGMGFGNKNSIVIQETEYIGEVTSSSTSFKVLSSYPINPGQAQTFPWLSTIAQNYEKYEFLALQWIYKPEVSQYATNGQTGKILLSVDYDASDAPPQNKMEMEDVVPHADSMPYQQLKLNCKPSEMHKNSDAKYIRNGGLPGNSDIKTYDAGNLFVGSSGIATSSGVLGELHVKYIVKLSIPIVQSGGIPTNYSVADFAQPTTALASGNTLNLVIPFSVTNSNGLQLVNTGGSIGVTQPGYYQIQVNVLQLATTAVLSSMVVQLQVNGTLVGTQFVVQYPNEVNDMMVGGTQTLFLNKNSLVEAIFSTNSSAGSYTYSADIIFTLI